MTFDYTALRDNTVEPLIAEFGDDGQIGVNDASTGAPYESQLASETLHPGKFVRTKFTKADNNGTLVEKGDVLFLLSTQGIVINLALAHRIIVDTTYQVVRIDPLRPGPVTILWKVHARK